MISGRESNIEVYNQILDLQKKLKQSEAERIRLEEMFDFLMKTLKEEKEMQLKSVENRYHAFLEDCARRNNRNENILRSVERIESAANILHAKSERLKLLRNYYEGYLERIIPFWKQPSIFYGPNQFSYNELDWIRRKQLISEEIPSSLFHNANCEDSKSLRLNESNVHRLIPESENIQFSGSLTSNCNNLNKNFWIQANKENEWGNKLGANHTVQKDNVDLSLSVSTNKLLDHTNRFQCDYFEQETKQKNEMLTNFAEPLFPQNILENDWELVQGNSRQQKFSNLEKSNCSENSYHILHQDDLLNKSKRLVTPSEEQKFGIKETSAKRKDKITSEENTRLEKQFIVREPVEIKKPEFMVGKLHSDITKTFEGLKNNAEHENVEKEDLDKRIKSMMEPENVFIPCSREESSLLELPHSEDVKIVAKNKWSVLKQHDNVDNLKKILTENQSDLDESAMKLMKSIHRLSFTESQSSSKPKDENEAALENNSRPQDDEKFLEFSNDKGGKPTVYEDHEIILTEALDLKDNEKNELGPKGNINEQPKGQFNNNLIQKEGICDLGEEVYEDNEESYPDSYFEQPPKSHFPTNIVSNVILEEDESEVNSNDTCAEIECDNHTLQKNVEDEKFENPQENVNDVDGQNDFNERNHQNVREVCENPNLYENIVSDEQSILNNHMNFYANENNYPNSFREEVIYENREENDDSYMLKEQDNITGEHHVDDPFSEHCFENEHLQEIIEDRQIYQNQQNKQNQEITPALEHYANDDDLYQMQYCEQSNNNGRGVYYEQEGINDEYFQNNLQHNNDLKENQESTENFHQAHIGHNPPYGENDCPRQSVNNLAHLLESDSESFQIEHGSGIGNEDSDFDFSSGHQ